MTTHRIQPHQSAGQVKLGMSREEVCRLFDEPPHAFRKTPASSSETFAFFDGSITVFFAPENDTVEFIELASGSHGSFSIDGINVFVTSADDLLEKLGKQYEIRVEEDGCTVILEGQDVSLWRSDADSQYFDAVGVGVPNYFRSGD